MLRYLIFALVILNFPAYGEELSSAAKESSGFAAGPYLLDVTTDSATVAFRLHEPLPAKVRIFADVEVKEFESPERNRAHFIRVTGLSPGTTCNYRVICGRGEVRTPEKDDSFQIRTAGRPGESFTFAVYGDPRPGDTGTTRFHREVIEQVILNEPAFCLVLGDMVDDGGRPELWEEFFRVESELLRSSAIYPVTGDNDYARGKGIAAGFFPKLEKGYYHFEWAGIQFFGLHAWDTRGEQPGEEIGADSAQVRWLETELSKEEIQKAAFRVVFLHDPVYICRGRSAEALRRVWAPIFQRYRVDLVFASWHLYERSVCEGITYVISGGAGAELIWMKKDPGYPSQAEARRHHFCRVDVSSGAMIIRAVGTDGTVLDTITLTRGVREPGAAGRIERAARLLRQEITINEGYDNPVIPLYLFSYDCSYCRKLLRNDLPGLAGKNNVAFKVLYYDFGQQGTYELFLNAGAEFGRQGADVPAIFIGRSVLGGEAEINRLLPKEIAAFLKAPERYRARMIVPFKQRHDTGTMGEEAFNALTSGIVLGAGLLDGVNPCAFTTIIFLISYLSLVGVSRRQMVYTGGMFTLAVFLTYFAIGLAFFNFARLILQDRTMARIVNVLLLLVVAALAGFSLVDFVRCLKGRARDITLQLPEFLKAGIRLRIRDFARNKIAVTGTSFVLGVVIAGMELTCTGQVYIPIVTMISEPRYRVAAASYLVLYNVAFILPLVAVFLLATLGLTSEHMAAFFRRRVAGVKLGLAVVFMVMAVMIVYNLRYL